MKDIKIKCFIVPKERYSDLCQDSLAVNLKRGRFAIADGVTNSNHPEIFSRLLSETFVMEDISIQDWPTIFEEKMLLKISDEWKDAEEAIFTSLTGRQRNHAQLRRDYYSPGASTLAGIEIDKDNMVMQYQIIGDSTLFVLGSDGTYFAINSESNSSEKGQLLPFNNTPGTIVANGKIHGEWVSGQCNLQEGYIALMTDGCANWFQNEYANDTSIVEKLWNLHDNDEFAAFVESVWMQQPNYEDDWALILIKLEKKVYEMTYFPNNQPQALFIGYEEPNNETEQEIASNEEIDVVQEEDNEVTESINLEEENGVLIDDNTSQVAVEESTVEETKVVENSEVVESNIPEKENGEIIDNNSSQEAIEDSDAEETEVVDNNEVVESNIPEKENGEIVNNNTSQEAIEDSIAEETEAVENNIIKIKKAALVTSNILNLEISRRYHCTTLTGRKSNEAQTFSGDSCLVFPMTENDGTKKIGYRVWYIDNLNYYMLQVAKEVGQELPKIKLPYFVDYQYLDEAINVEGVLIPGARMEWVEGDTLDAYIKNHRSSRELRWLAYDFQLMCIDFATAGIAHGDLSNSNILVTKKGNLRLVDYDSLFLSSMKGKYKQTTTGQPAFQHPQRVAGLPMTEKDDNFSQLVIYLSLLAMSHNLSLVDYINDRELLFNKSELQSVSNFRNSRVYKAVSSLNIQNVQTCLSALEKAIAGSLSAVPSLTELLDLPLRSSPYMHINIRYCPVCGKQYSSKDTSFCSNCNHPREIEKLW